MHGSGSERIRSPVTFFGFRFGSGFEFSGKTGAGSGFGMCGMACIECKVHVCKPLSFYYTRRITPKLVTIWRCPSPRHSAKATQLPSQISKRWRTVCSAVQDLAGLWETNSQPPAHKARALTIRAWRR